MTKFLNKTKDALRFFVADFFWIIALAVVATVTLGWQKAMLWIGSGALLAVFRRFAGRA